MVQIKTTHKGEVTIRMNGNSEKVLQELSAVAAKMNKLSRDLKGIAERLGSEDMRVIAREERATKARATA